MKHKFIGGTGGGHAGIVFNRLWFQIGDNGKK